MTKLNFKWVNNPNDQEGISDNQAQLANGVYEVLKNQNLNDCKRALTLILENLDRSSTVN